MGWEPAVPLLQNAHTDCGCQGCPDTPRSGRLAYPMLIIYSGIRVAPDARMFRQHSSYLCTMTQVTDDNPSDLGADFCSPAHLAM